MIKLFFGNVCSIYNIAQKGHYCIVYCIEMVLVISGFLALKKECGQGSHASRTALNFR